MEGGIGGSQSKEQNQIVDVRSVVESVSAEDSDAPLYQVESLCMRCGENVLSFPLCLYVSSFLLRSSLFGFVL